MEQMYWRRKKYFGKAEVGINTSNYTLFEFYLNFTFKIVIYKNKKFRMILIPPLTSLPKHFNPFLYFIFSTYFQSHSILSSLYFQVLEPYTASMQLPNRSTTQSTHRAGSLYPWLCIKGFLDLFPTAGSSQCLAPGLYVVFLNGAA